MVRNETTAHGDSIAERYGRPVTASDIEDLLYRENVLPATRVKVMDAVRRALSWNRAAAVRPWAGELEEGLTRQEQQRADARRAQLREQLLAEAAARAAATEENDSRTLDEVLADASARAAAAVTESQTVNSPEADVPASGISSAGESQKVNSPEPDLADPAVAGEVQDAPPAPRTRTQEALNYLPGGIPTGAFSDVPEALLEAPEPDAQMEDELAEFEPLLEVPPALRPAARVPDAPARPAAPARDVAAAPAGTAVPPAPSEAPRPVLAGSKTCTRCGREKPLEFFQRDSRSTDGRRSSCKTCSSIGDALRKSLKKSFKKATDDAVRAVEEQMATEIPEESTEQESIRMESEPEEAAAVRLAGEPEEPQAQGPEDWRTCRKCGILKAPEDYYIRLDGRLRYACRDCERADSERRRLARKARRAEAEAKGR